MPAAIEPEKWEAIELEYMHDPKATYSRVANKFGVSLGSVNSYAKTHGWAKKKKKIIAKQRQQLSKEINKNISKQAKKIANVFTAELEAADLLLKKLLETAKDNQQFNRHLVQIKRKRGREQDEWIEEREFEVVDTKRLKDASSALKELTMLKKYLKGVLTEPEQEKMNMDRQKIELEEMKVKHGFNGPGDDGDETGVTVIPAQDFSLLENAIVESETVINTGEVLNEPSQDS